MHNKKGQAASEFLMTYGFAIMAVIVAVSALSYIGVNKIKGIVPSKCFFKAPLPCVDFTFDSSAETITLAMRNNNGFPINITGTITISDGCNSPTITSINEQPPNFRLNNNEIARVVILCPGLQVGKFKSDINIQYYNTNTGLYQNHFGEIVGFVS